MVVSPVREDAGEVACDDLNDQTMKRKRQLYLAQPSPKPATKGVTNEAVVARNRRLPRKAFVRQPAHDGEDFEYPPDLLTRILSNDNARRMNSGKKDRARRSQPDARDSRFAFTVPNCPTVDCRSSVMVWGADSRIQ